VSGPIVDRCVAYRPCEDVTARLHHAEVADRHGMPDQARKLRDTASDIAERHNYGQGDQPAGER
jgi:hypothetical protein